MSLLGSITCRWCVQLKVSSAKAEVMVVVEVDMVTAQRRRTQTW